MMTRYLLDTSVVIGYMALDPEITKRLEENSEAHLCVPVVGELLYGALLSTRVTANIARVESLTSGSTVLNCTRETARRYAGIHHNLRIRGHLIPVSDIWIAAIAQEHGLTIATRDTHFRRVSGVSAEFW